ncbi:MAG: hypothetical protein OEW53_05820 [Actinomycetota bacterium]|nr:hypothetical protein [Actinomycetota bacterium]
MTEPTVPPPGDLLPRCPGCDATLPADPGADPVTCRACGRAMPRAALTELTELDAWRSWASARRSWLRDRLAAGDLPATGWSALGGEQPARLPGAAPAGGAVRPGPPPRNAPAAGTVLLAGGAVLLVLAGIAFVAFAWDLLGPVGQLVTLFALGGAALTAGVRLRARLPGTATTLGVVGALLVAVSTVATRSLGVDVVGETGALVAAAVASVLLAGVGVAVRSRLAAVGEVAALTGATLTLALLATAPADEAVPLGDAWAWWAAAVLLLGAVALLLLADELRVRTWPPLAAVSLVLGALVLAGYLADRGELTDENRLLVFSGVLLGAAVVDVLLARGLPHHRHEPGWSGAALVGVAILVAWVSGAALPESRPRSALVLVAVVALAGWTRHWLTDALRAPLDFLAAAVGASAVGLLVAPWADDWAGWQGPVAGLALAAVVVGLAEVDPRRERDTPAQGALTLVAAAAGLGTWLVAVTGGPPPSEAVRRGIAAALILVGAAAWAEALRRRLPAWSVWFPGLAVGVALALLLETGDLDPAYAPEIYGVVLAAVAGAAGALTWYLRRPSPTPSLVTVGPALTLALAPTTLAMVDQAFGQWWWSADPGTAYQVRVGALFVVGALGVVIGSWRRLAGVVAPCAAALLVVTTVQLVELGRFLPQWVSFAVAGALLVGAGARWESVRSLGRQGTTWARHLT